jgi:hypothetical protein
MDENMRNKSGKNDTRYVSLEIVLTLIARSTADVFGTAARSGLHS